jgi:hypothetical protein
LRLFDAGGRVAAAGSDEDQKWKCSHEAMLAPQAAVSMPMSLSLR